MSSNAVDELLQQPGIWRAGEQARTTGLEHISSGFAALDQALPGGGWPLGALTEVLHDLAGIGELRLLMPALARLSRSGRWVALVAPPYIPYAPALAACGVDLSRLLLVHPRTPQEGLWALEQALHAGTCGAVLAWPRQIDERSLRRLQLAAEAGRCWGVLFRPTEAAAHASPAALRLQLRREEQTTSVRLLKCRGGQSGLEFRLDLDSEHVEPPRLQEALPAPAAPRPLRRPLRTTAVRNRRPAALSSLPPRLPQMELPLMATTAEPAGTAATAALRPKTHWPLNWLHRK